MLEVPIQNFPELVRTIELFSTSLEEITSSFYRTLQAVKEGPNGPALTGATSDIEKSNHKQLTNS